MSMLIRLMPQCRFRIDNAQVAEKFWKLVETSPILLRDRKFLSFSASPARG